MTEDKDNIIKAVCEGTQKARERFGNEVNALRCSKAFLKRLLIHFDLRHAHNEVFFKAQKECATTEIAFLGMTVDYYDPMPENKVIMCRKTRDKDGIPTYRRYGVIELAPRIIHEYKIELEPYHFLDVPESLK